MTKEEGMKALKKIGVLSTAYLASIFYAIFGLFQGVALAIQLKNPLFAANVDPLILESIGDLGWWLVLFLPIVFAVVGFVAGALISFLYNSIAKFTGGIRVYLE